MIADILEQFYDRLKHAFQGEHKPKKEKTPKVEKSEAEALKVGFH